MPFKYIVDWPIKFGRYIFTSLSANQALIEQNTNLQANNILLEAKLQKFIDLEKENKELRALLGSNPQPHERILAAQVLVIQAEPYLSQIVIDKGTKDGVYLNQPVIDAKGIVGQVIETDAYTSRVMLVTDSRNAVPVRVVRTGMHAITLGNGALGTLSLAHIPITLDIKEGDQLISSGLGQRYPNGYPVGVVKRVSRETDNDFAAVIVKPSAQLNHNRLVLLVWPKLAKLPESDKEKSNDESK
jgi:rod shape-determining protein MreC